MLKRSALLLAASLIASPVLAQDYYDRGEEGWFWYKDDPVVEKEEEPEEPEPKPPEVAKQEETEPKPPSEPSGPPALSAAWYEENLERYLHRAIDEPTPENVEAYYRLQRIGLEKAHVFAEVAQQVVANNPDLDNFGARPPSGPGSQALEAQARENKSRVADQVWQQAGVAFFYESECVLCDQQAIILGRLANSTDLTVMPVSLDGSEPHSALAGMNAVEDQGQAEMLEIEAGPVLYLLRPPSEWIPISAGMLSENQIYDRTIQVAHSEGWIDDATYESTRPINRQRMATNLPGEAASLPEDPAKLVQLLSTLESRR